METTWTTRLNSETLKKTLVHLYGAEHVDGAYERCVAVTEEFFHTFSVMPEALFSAPGRSELGGNHTDHQHGHVLAAAINMDLLAAVRPNGMDVIRLCSEGYGMMEIDLRERCVHPEETNTTAALIRGVAAGIMGQGYTIHGFDAFVVSSVPGGSGLSSSAAFEVLVGTILNELFLGGALRPMALARIGQYAENVYFGKPCGLMDQTACAVGGVVAIDFADTEEPAVEQIALDLREQGYALCIIASGADHADLTAEYAAITNEMKAVSHYFGKEVLREVPQEDLLAALPDLRRRVGDRAVVRALHFYGEDRRAREEATALKTGDFQRFLSLVRASGHSSAMYLQNILPAGAVTKQELMVTMALCEHLVADRGAVRVHGGGFGGTAQAFVPLDRLETFRDSVEAVLGSGCCYRISLRPVGGVRLL